MSKQVEKTSTSRLEKIRKKIVLGREAGADPERKLKLTRHGLKIYLDDVEFLLSLIDRYETSLREIGESFDDHDCVNNNADIVYAPCINIARNALAEEG